MSNVERLWRGETDLWKTYWLWGTLGSFVLGQIIHQFPGNLVILGLVISNGYLVLTAVGIWRSAGLYSKQHPGKIWGKLARASLFMGPALVLVFFVIGFLT